MGLVDETVETHPGPQCTVIRMLEAVQRHPNAEPLTRAEFDEALDSDATARSLARVLRKRYEGLGITVASDQVITRHRRQECQNCYGPR